MLKFLSFDNFLLFFVSYMFKPLKWLLGVFWESSHKDQLLKILFHGPICRTQAANAFKECHDLSSHRSVFTLTFNQTILICKFSLQMIIRALMRFHLPIALCTVLFSSCHHSDLVFRLNFTVVTFLSPPNILYNKRLFPQTSLFMHDRSLFTMIWNKSLNPTCCFF